MKKEREREKKKNNREEEEEEEAVGFLFAHGTLISIDCVIIYVHDLTGWSAVDWIVVCGA